MPAASIWAVCNTGLPASQSCRLRMITPSSRRFRVGQRSTRGPTFDAKNYLGWVTIRCKSTQRVPKAPLLAMDASHRCSMLVMQVLRLARRPQADQECQHHQHESHARREISMADDLQTMAGFCAIFNVPGYGSSLYSEHPLHALVETAGEKAGRVPGCSGCLWRSNADGSVHDECEISRCRTT